jgi:hypothetical protein
MERQRNKAEHVFGYVPFDTLQKKDILSVLAAMKAGNAYLGKSDGDYVSYRLAV